MKTFDYLVVGGGIVGLATAWRLLQRHPGASLVLLEKEPALAQHQSGHNSGVVHAGVYYAPGSLKARLCRAGWRETLAFAAAHDVPLERCGKLIVATSAVENERLRELEKNAGSNGLTVEWLDGASLRAREPAVSGTAALWVDATAIVDYPALCQRLAALIRDAGGVITTGESVLALREDQRQVEVDTNRNSYSAAQMVVCAGLQSDRLARMAGLEPDFAVVPFRGDYYDLPASRSDLVSALIYPVPDPRLPFLGVHLTRTTDKRITVGPSAMLALARERYRRWACNAADARDVLGFAGTWRLLARYPRAGCAEFLHAASKRSYLAAVRRYCPELELSDLSRAACGIRAQVVRRNGELVHDFLLHATSRSVHVINAPSPAATAAFPIADEILARLPPATRIHDSERHRVD